MDAEMMEVAVWIDNNSMRDDVDVIFIQMAVMVTSDCVTHLSPSSTFHFPCQQMTTPR